jgi:malonyl-CoA/methylmalonyl-CoA synthetase
MNPAVPTRDDPSAWFDIQAPQRPFLSTPDGRKLSYADMLRLSTCQACALAALGVRAGDRVAVQVEKSPEAFLLYLGCLRLGAVFVPLNTAYTVPELDYFLGDSQPRLVVVRPQDQGALTPLAEKHGVLHLETLGTQGDGSLAEAARAAGPDGFVPLPADPEALASQLYTSGTTGRSKGAMITRRNLAVSAAALAEAWHFSADDVLLHALPIFHIHGLFISANTVLAAGASMIFLPRFDAE